MLAQAAGFAVLAAISPTALLVIAVYLGSARPRLTGMYYLAGAVLMSILTGVIVLVAVRSGGLSHPSEHTPRYGLRLGLGVLAVIAGAGLATRTAKPPDPASPGRGLVSRMVANPSPWAAFIVGMIVFTPSVTFIAAVQVIATARADIELSALALTIVVVLNVLLVWLPILAHLAVPDRTSRTLAAFNGWLRAHGRSLLAIAAATAGVILIVNGLAGLL
ncbi:MAG TPA: GAP family protein [Streptosporangiaceae bacterium]|nr:GAP family protein [Streptosporangiaceae bacterium]